VVFDSENSGKVNSNHDRIKRFLDYTLHGSSRLTCLDFLE